jgi:hypothetical protein
MKRDLLQEGDLRMSDTKDRASIGLSSNFLFGELRADQKKVPPPTPPPPLGPLAAFAGDFAGNGFNTIFRPDSAASPTALPNPVPPAPPHDNILELNLTSETLSFSKSLGSVPNRGTGAQADAFLNGVPYVQSISDITIHGEKVGIHFEPGIWIHVPATTIPPLGGTVARMASIPHGTTIDAQGLVNPATPGPPTIAAVDITPIINASNTPFRFPSQTTTDPNTLRIPQDLGPFITRGTITQAMLDDPNSLLRAHISKQIILTTTTLFISTAPPPPVGLFGGGTDNIAFLLGQPAATAPNAQSTKMTAVFWIETVQEVIQVSPHLVAGEPIKVNATPSIQGQRVPTFIGIAPFDHPHQVTVKFTQIQYTQTVLLNFNGLTWPHVSVNTLVPADDIEIPASAWK